MKSRISQGKYGESIAINYVVNLGWSIITRNYRRKSDEIDAIAKTGDGLLVFIEVKTRTINNLSTLDALTPEDNLTAHKLHKISRTCEFFAREHPELVSEDLGWRIDLISVELHTDGEHISAIRHYENI